MKNGKLLRLAGDAGFNALITTDASLPYQQNPAKLPLAVVVLRAASNDIDDLRPLAQALIEALEDLKPHAVTVVA